MEEYSLKLDYYGLLNLHKALLEAKFHTAPDNKLISGSPIIANIYIQIRDLLIENDRENEWRDWFQLSNRLDRRNQAIFLMKKCKHWSKATPDKKCEIVSNYLAPFFFDDEELKSLIAEVDKFFEEERF
ncbi:MAG: hypothetical protein HFJ80_04340 [Clostridiales bacterium]|nr:hypothetical protein [Clostridiales bacterium]